MKKFLTSKIGNILLCIAEIIVGVLLLVNPDAVTSCSSRACCSSSSAFCA